MFTFQKAKKPNFDDISFEIRPEVDKSAVSGSPATVTTTIPTKNNDKNNSESTATALSNNTSATAAGKDSKDKIRLNKPTHSRSGFHFPLRSVGGPLEFVTRLLGDSLKLSSSGLAISMTNLIVQNL